MAGTSFSPFKSCFLLASTVLLLFTPPIFSMLVFFWPLIVSTVLGVLAVVSFRQDGISTVQEEEVSENRVANLNMLASSTADMEKISDVLMVGNQEVTWLEWLHNEDMENCHAQERANCMPARWDLDELDAACEAFVGTLSSRVEERYMVDAYGSIVVDESSAYEQVENADDAPSTAIPCDDIWVRSQVDKKLNLVGLVSPVLDVSRADAIGYSNVGVDVVRLNTPPLKPENTAKEIVLADNVTNLTQKDGDLLIAEGVLVENAFTITTSNGSEYGVAERDEVETSISGQTLTVQSESTAHVLALEVRDATTTHWGGSKLECSSVDADGECILGLTSKVMSATDASEASFAANRFNFTSEMEALEGHQMRHIHKEDAGKRNCRENNESPIWVVMKDKEETKSSLRFSFFDKGCLTLTPVKHEVTLHT